MPPTLHRLTIGTALLILTACQAEQISDAPARNSPPPAPFLTAVYDTAMDVTGNGTNGHAYGFSDGGLIVGDHGGLPFTWRQPGGPLRTLALPPGLQGSGSATSISPAGKFIAGVGSAPGSGTTHAVLWDGRGMPTDLGTLGGGSSYANAVSDKGTVVGWAETPRGIMHAFRYTKAGGMVDPGILPGSSRTARMQAWDLNDSEIVGCGNGPSGSYDMWRWAPVGGFTNLGTGIGLTCAYAVNATGAVAGASDQFGGFTWTAARGFRYANPATNIAHDIDASGVSVGETGGYTQAFVADPRGRVTLLPAILPSPAQSSASAFAINVCGDVVGWSREPFVGETHAVWWPGHRCP